MFFRFGCTKTWLKKCRGELFLGDMAVGLMQEARVSH